MAELWEQMRDAVEEAGYELVGTTRYYLRYKLAERKSLVIPTDATAPEYDRMITAATLVLENEVQSGNRALRVLNALADRSDSA